MHFDKVVNGQKAFDLGFGEYLYLKQFYPGNIHNANERGLMKCFICKSEFQIRDESFRPQKILER